MTSILLSLLPRRYRSSQIGSPSAMASGILQMAVCLGLLIYRYLQFVPN
jgi:hypothetical protein